MRIWTALLIALLLPIQSFAEVERRSANSGNVIVEDVPAIPNEIRAALQRYQNTRSAGLADWSLAGDSIFITTRFAEVNQLHRVDRPGGARHQVTWFDEPIGGASRRPGHDTLAFLMDEGGSEFSQIFLFDPADGSYRMISDGQSRNQSLTWSDDGRYLAFTSTRRNGRSNDVWMFDFEAGGEPRPAEQLILEAPDGFAWAAVDFAPDNARVLIQQYISINDARIFALDLSDGSLTPVVGGDDAPSANQAFAFTANGRAVLFGTDAGSEHIRLARIGLEEDAEPQILTRDIDWSVEGLTLNHAREAGVFSVNEGGISRLYRFDPASGDYSPLEGIPQGVIGGLAFSPDDGKLGMVVNNARSPSDIHVLDWASGELTRWTWSEVGGLDPEGFVMPELIEYPTFDEVDGRPRMIPAFVYRPSARLIHHPSYCGAARAASAAFRSVAHPLPAVIYEPGEYACGALGRETPQPLGPGSSPGQALTTPRDGRVANKAGSGEGPHPVIVSIHGGPEGQARPTFSSTYQLWVDRLGAAVVVPNVRGSSGYGKTYLQLDNGYLREDSVKDIGALLDWISDQPDLDQSRVAVYGGSYGGYMVLASSVHYSDRLAAAVDIVGISNFVTFLENTQDYRRDLRRPEYGDERDPEMRAFLESISPLNNVEKIDVPMFVVQGNNDPRVPVSEAEQMVSALREQGSPVWYMNALNEGHGFRKKENRDLFSEATILFLERHLLQ